MLKDNKGITLATLAVTIIIMLIIVSVATVSGKGAIDYVKFNNAKAQFQIMQSHVNSWYEEYKNNVDVLDYGEDITTSNLDATLVANTLYDEDTGASNVGDYKYFRSTYIKDTLNIDGISHDFFIDIKNRSVLLFGGITYDGETYYSAEQFGINVIQYNELSGDIKFNTTIENGYIIVYNIRFPEGINISKFEIQYQVKGEEYWSTVTTDMKKLYQYEENGETKQDNNAWFIPIEKSGEYDIKITTASNNMTSSSESDIVEITVENMRRIGTVFVKDTKLTDTNGDIIVVPTNFKISLESPLNVTEGMIIEDNEGNQYIWIPVFEKTDERDWGANYSSVTSKDDWEAIESALINTEDGYTKQYRDPDYTDSWYGDENFGKCGYYNGSDFVYYTNGNMTKEEYDTLYHNMLKSVYKNGGFYIGRYEMGIARVSGISEAEINTRNQMSEYNASTEIDNTNTTVVSNGAPSLGDMTAPLSKSNTVGYTYITQSQAQMLAKKLEEESGYSNVNCSIMFGVQWDAVCVFIERFDNNEKKKELEDQSQWIKENTYSILWGNYQNSTFEMNRGFYNIYTTKFAGWQENSTKTNSTEMWLCTTGASDQNSSLNIYDFGGNLTEWTLECCNDAENSSVVRGNTFTATDFASHRYNTYTYTNNYRFSSRTAFFIK